jgi:hypothetical protein
MLGRSTDGLVCNYKRLESKQECENGTAESGQARPDGETLPLWGAPSVYKRDARKNARVYRE